MSGLLNLIIEIVEMFATLVYIVYDTVFSKFALVLNPFPSFNIYLFSDTGWFSQPVSVISVLVLISVIFAFIFVIRLLWNGTKKFIKMIFGVFRL